MSSSPRPPEAPEQQSALLPIMLNMLVNRQNQSSPFGGQEYGSYDQEGNFQSFNPNDPSVIAAIQAAFANPANPDIASFLSVMPTAARTFESPRQEEIRTRREDQDDMRRAIAAQYMSQFNVSDPLPGSDMSKPLGTGNIPTLPPFAQVSPLELDRYAEFFRRGKG